MSGRGRVALLAAGSLALVGASTGVARAAWADQQLLAGAPTTGFVVPSPQLSCTPSGRFALIEWTPATPAPVPVTYATTLDGQPVTPTPLANGRLRVTVEFTGALGTFTRTVRVTAGAAGTAWTAPVSSRSASGTQFLFATTSVSCG